VTACAGSSAPRRGRRTTGDRRLKIYTLSE
jgi:hypothetical protein